MLSFVKKKDRLKGLPLLEEILRNQQKQAGSDAEQE
jgi:hypothetical protein